MRQVTTKMVILCPSQVAHGRKCSRGTERSDIQNKNYNYILCLIHHCNSNETLIKIYNEKTLL